MKGQLVLEYRIRKLEKLLFEDVIDDELDAMSDEIVKNNPYVDIGDEVDKKAKDIIDKEPGYFYHTDEYGDNPRTFNMIDEWLDDKVIETELDPESYFDGDAVKRLNGVLRTITRLSDGLDTVRYLKKKIKEISKMNVLVAQQKLVSALRKRIKEEEVNSKRLLIEHKHQFSKFINDLKEFIDGEIKKHVSKVSYKVESVILPNKEFSADVIVRDKLYKDRTVTANITECKHIAWNKDHFYDVKMKKRWPSEAIDKKTTHLNEDEVKLFLSSTICWKLNGYEFDDFKV